MQISGKRAVVTGAGSGLGRALAIQLARRGAAVAVADIDARRARETLESLPGAQTASGQESFASSCDVGSTGDMAALAAEVEHRWGGADILVNNAGVSAAGRLEETADADWQWMLNINLMGVVRGCRAFAPMLRRQSEAHIVNVASFAGIACAPGMVSYNVAKAGVIAVSESLRGELADTGVGVSVACPAFFASKLLESFRAPPGLREQVQRVMDRSPVTATDVAGDILDAIGTGRFMVITHKEARRGWRLKRMLPGVFFRSVLNTSKRFQAGGASTTESAP